MQISNAPPPEIPTGRPAAAPGSDGAARGTAGPAFAADRADIRPLDVPGALQILVAEVRASLDAFLLAALAQTPAPQPPEDAPALPIVPPLPADALPQQASPPLPPFAAAAVPQGAPPPNSSAPQTAPQAAQQLVEAFLRSVPQSAVEAPAQVRTVAPQVWLSAAAQAEVALRAGTQAALQTIETWREVPPATVEAAHEAAGLALSLLAEDAQNPLWLRPEWLGLAPRFQQFWRRRRRARRRLSDPDYAPGRALDEKGSFIDDDHL